MKIIDIFFDKAIIKKAHLTIGEIMRGKYKKRLRARDYNKPVEDPPAPKVGDICQCGGVKTEIMPGLIACADCFR